MNIRITTLLFLLILFFSISCSVGMRDKVSKENFKEDIAVLFKEKFIDDSVKTLIEKYVSSQNEDKNYEYTLYSYNQLKDIVLEVEKNKVKPSADIIKKNTHNVLQNISKNDIKNSILKYMNENRLGSGCNDGLHLTIEDFFYKNDKYFCFVTELYCGSGPAKETFWGFILDAFSGEVMEYDNGLSQYSPQLVNNWLYKKSQLERLNYLYEYNNKYPSDVKLFENTKFRSRIENLFGRRFHFIITNWKIFSPIIIHDDKFIIEGSSTNKAATNQFIIVVDLKRDLVFAGVKEEDWIDTYSENGEETQDLLKRYATLTTW